RDFHVTGVQTCALPILVGDSPFAHVGDDFHVVVGMRRKTAVRRDGVIVPDPQATPVHTLRIVVFGEGKVVLGIQPAVIGGAEARSEERRVGKGSGSRLL